LQITCKKAGGTPIFLNILLLQSLLAKTEGTITEFFKNALDDWPFYSEIGVPNFILIGRRQKEEYLDCSHYTKEKVRYEATDLERVF